LLDAEISKKIKTSEYIKKLAEKQNWLKEKFSSFVNLIESHIMQKVHEEFEAYFQKWVSVLLEDESINAKLDEDFTPNVEQNGFLMNIGDLSGGEKTSFALAYRLALNKVINDVLSVIKTKDLLILDEPTDGFSSEQLDKVRDVLEQLDIAQIIIVSHEPKLESFVQNIIRIDKNHHTSRVLA
jgi:exonuclease SbcC